MNVGKSTAIEGAETSVSIATFVPLSNLPNIAGAIDSTLIKIEAPKNSALHYFSRYQQHNVGKSESGILLTRTQSSNQTMNINNTSIRNVDSTVVAVHLRNLFPTVGKRSFGGKLSNSNVLKVRSLQLK